MNNNKTIIGAMLEADPKIPEKKIDNLNYKKMTKITLRLILKNTCWSTYFTFIVVPFVILVSKDAWFVAISVLVMLVLQYLLSFVIGVRVGMGGQVIEEMLKESEQQVGQNENNKKI